MRLALGMLSVLVIYQWSFVTLVRILLIATSNHTNGHDYNQQTKDASYRATTEISHRAWRRLSRRLGIGSLLGCTQTPELLLMFSQADLLFGESKTREVHMYLYQCQPGTQRSFPKLIILTWHPFPQPLRKSAPLLTTVWTVSNVLSYFLCSNSTRQEEGSEVCPTQNDDKVIPLLMLSTASF